MARLRFWDSHLAAKVSNAFEKRVASSCLWEGRGASEEVENHLSMDQADSRPKRVC